MLHLVAHVTYSGCSNVNLLLLCGWLGLAGWLAMTTRLTLCPPGLTLTLHLTDSDVSVMHRDRHTIDRSIDRYAHHLDSHFHIHSYLVSSHDGETLSDYQYQEGVPESAAVIKAEKADYQAIRADPASAPMTSLLPHRDQDPEISRCFLGSAFEGPRVGAHT